jgi:zinc/manganese transport system substrate-binding protein
VAVLVSVASGCGGDDSASETPVATEPAATDPVSSDAPTSEAPTTEPPTTEPPTTEPAELQTVVVTHSVLGAVVSDLVGDAAEVVVLMPNGVDPHDWEASAKDIEAVNSAAVVVANGLDLEESLVDTLETAESDGATVFYASDHIDVRTIGEGEVGESHSDEDGHEDEKAEDEHGHEEDKAEDEHGHEEDKAEDEHSEDEHSEDEHSEDEHSEDEHSEDEHSEDEHSEDEHSDHGAGAEDPHMWMDPLAMSDVVAALAPVLAEAGVEVTDRVADVQADLEALDTEVDDTLSVIDDADRQLVSGHESLGYFADRYGFVLVGAVIPGLTSQAEASAGDLAELKETMEAAGVTTIFTEIGTPDSVVQAIADEAGAQVIELGTHTLPDDGTYRTFMLDIATLVADGLTA